MIGDQLKRLVERIERLDAEITELNGDKKDLYAEAKSNGYDVKALKYVVAERRKDPAKVAEFETVVGLYKAALGMLPDDDIASRVHAHEEAEDQTAGDLAVSTEPAGRSADESPATIPKSAETSEADVSPLEGPLAPDDGGVASVEASAEPSRGGGTPAPISAGPFRPDLEIPAELRRA